MAKIAMRPGYSFIDTVGEEAGTADLVEQTYVVCKLEELVNVTWNLLKAQMMNSDFKVVVFFTTARRVLLSPSFPLGFDHPVANSADRIRHVNQQDDPIFRRNVQRLWSFRDGDSFAQGESF
jgi:hypothetical protein